MCEILELSNKIALTLTSNFHFLPEFIRQSYKELSSLNKFKKHLSDYGPLLASKQLLEPFSSEESLYESDTSDEEEDISNRTKEYSLYEVGKMFLDTSATIEITQDNNYYLCLLICGLHKETDIQDLMNLLKKHLKPQIEETSNVIYKGQNSVVLKFVDHIAAQKGFTFLQEDFYAKAFLKNRWQIVRFYNRMSEPKYMSQFFGIVVKNLPDGCTVETVSNLISMNCQNMSFLSIEVPAMVGTSYCTIIRTKTLEDAEILSLTLNGLSSENETIQAGLHPNCNFRGQDNSKSPFHQIKSQKNKQNSEKKSVTKNDIKSILSIFKGESLEEKTLKQTETETAKGKKYWDTIFTPEREENIDVKEKWESLEFEETTKDESNKSSELGILPVENYFDPRNKNIEREIISLEKDKSSIFAFNNQNQTNFHHLNFSTQHLSSTNLSTSLNLNVTALMQSQKREEQHRSNHQMPVFHSQVTNVSQDNQKQGVPLQKTFNKPLANNFRFNFPIPNEIQGVGDIERMKVSFVQSNQTQPHPKFINQAEGKSKNGLICPLPDYSVHNVETVNGKRTFHEMTNQDQIYYQNNRGNGSLETSGRNSNQLINQTFERRNIQKISSKFGRPGLKPLIFSTKSSVASPLQGYDSQGFNGAQIKTNKVKSKKKKKSKNSNLKLPKGISDLGQTSTQQEKIPFLQSGSYLPSNNFQHGKENGIDFCTPQISSKNPSISERVQLFNQRNESPQSLQKTLQIKLDDWNIGIVSNSLNSVSAATHIQKGSGAKNTELCKGRDFREESSEKALENLPIYLKYNVKPVSNLPTTEQPPPHSLSFLDFEAERFNNRGINQEKLKSSPVKQLNNPETKTNTINFDIKGTWLESLGSGWNIACKPVSTECNVHDNTTKILPQKPPPPSFGKKTSLEKENSKGNQVFIQGKSLNEKRKMKWFEHEQQQVDFQKEEVYDKPMINESYQDEGIQKLKESILDFQKKSKIPNGCPLSLKKKWKNIKKKKEKKEKVEESSSSEEEEDFQGDPQKKVFLENLNLPNFIDFKIKARKNDEEKKLTELNIQLKEGVHQQKHDNKKMQVEVTPKESEKTEEKNDKMQLNFGFFENLTGWSINYQSNKNSNSKVEKSFQENQSSVRKVKSGSQSQPTNCIENNNKKTIHTNTVLLDNHVKYLPQSHHFSQIYKVPQPQIDRDSNSEKKEAVKPIGKEQNKINETKRPPITHPHQLPSGQPYIPPPYMYLPHLTPPLYHPNLMLNMSYPQGYIMPSPLGFNPQMMIYHNNFILNPPANSQQLSSLDTTNPIKHKGKSANKIKKKTKKAKEIYNSLDLDIITAKRQACSPEIYPEPNETPPELPFDIGGNGLEELQEEK